MRSDPADLQCCTASFCITSANSVGAGGVGTFRLPAFVSGVGGSASTLVDFSMLPSGGQIAPGSTWNFQAWYRDPLAGGAKFNLSDGLQVNFCDQSRECLDRFASGPRPVCYPQACRGPLCLRGP